MIEYVPKIICVLNKMKLVKTWPETREDGKWFIYLLPLQNVLALGSEDLNTKYLYLSFEIE